MPKRSPDKTLSEVEETQAALRASIEQAKVLTAESERRVRQHRSEADESRPPKPAD